MIGAAGAGHKVVNKAASKSSAFKSTWIVSIALFVLTMLFADSEILPLSPKSAIKPPLRVRLLENWAFKSAEVNSTGVSRPASNTDPSETVAAMSSASIFP